MTRTLIENWRKWRHLDAESAVVQETPWESCPFWERHPAAFFVSYFVGLYICDYFCYNFGDLYHRTCFTQTTQILHVLLTYIAMSNRALFECSNIRILEYSNNVRYSNNTIRIRILFLYSNIRIFDYSPTHRWLVTQQAIGCHYFPPGLRLPSQPQSITAGTCKLYCLVTEANRCEQLAQGCYTAFARA